MLMKWSITHDRAFLSVPITFRVYTAITCHPFPIDLTKACRFSLFLHPASYCRLRGKQKSAQALDSLPISTALVCSQQRQRPNLHPPVLVPDRCHSCSLFGGPLPCHGSPCSCIPRGLQPDATQGLPARQKEAPHGRHAIYVHASFTSVRGCKKSGPT